MIPQLSNSDRNYQLDVIHQWLKDCLDNNKDEDIS